VNPRPAHRLVRSSRRHLLRGAIVTLAGLALATGTGVARADGTAQPPLPTIDVRVGGVPLTVEVASGGEQRYMGLSFRESLAEDAGMLFVYPDERLLTFTMRNTLLPLSIAFIDADLVIREIVDMDVGPGQLFDSAEPARYALEVNQGWFERHDVSTGALITMP